MRKNLRSIRRMLALFLLILSLLVSILIVPRLLKRSVQGRRLLAARLMQKHLQGMVKACGLRIHLHGTQPPPGETFLLLSNHVSYWDILALGSLFPLGFIAKDSIANWPVLGLVTSLCNTIFVSRDDVRKRWRTLRTLQQKISELSYCVFPEGTTTAASSPKLALWHRGNIAVLREPNRPVWLAGLHYHEHEKQAWIDDDALLPHIFQAMQAPHIDLAIHLQQLQHDSSDPLHQLSITAWSQTVKLCKNAQAQSFGKVKLFDSAVS